jgi:hypothetical protein
MDPEEQEVQDERHNNETNHSVGEVSIKVGLLSAPPLMAMKRQLTMECPFLMSRISHRSYKTAAPMLIKVNSPTILQPRVQASEAPVAKSQNHQVRVNSRYRCWWNLT